MAAYSERKFGPYLLGAQIGRGGMGVVHRATHDRTGQIVALKTVRLRSPELIASFRREVHALASLSHPGIVRIFEHGVVDAIPWYAMELVDGQTLARRMAGAAALATDTTAPCHSTERPTSSVDPSIPGAVREAMDLADVYALFRPICRALWFLHSHGLVHRDLKPENILVRPNGAPVLVDFGLVAQCGGGASREVLELADAGVGTVAYMAPEQRLGRFVDARADLFSLGCMLYQCITGALPFGTMGPRTLAGESPPLPSARNPAVPPELDAVVMGLLAKDPRNRMGYADDVDIALAGLSPDEGPISVRSSVYLYRPELVGREGLLSRLDRILVDALCGQGTMVLVTGESGVGKTRLVIELGAQAAEKGLTVVTADCPPVGAAAREGTTLGLPLGPFRGLLLAGADACRAGGEAVTQRLFGDRARVLAPYEPALARLPGQSEMPELEELPADAARVRLFANLWGFMVDFARERPLLLVIDDLQWTDDLSLEFLSSLSRAQIAEASIAIVGTCRVEEMSEGLRALASKEGMTREQLTRFDREAILQMVGGMLAMPTPPAELVDFLHVESSGNPFFIAEYLRAAIAERILRRDSTGRWILDFAGKTDELRERVTLPPRIGSLVATRLRDLDSVALETLHAAAVLGRDFDVDLVARTAQLDVSAVLSAYATLSQRQILEEDPAGASRFAHDKLREIAYSEIEGSRRQYLHRCAAESIEARRAGRALEPHLGALGYHYAKADMAAPAARYFELAGHHARKSYANRDSSRLYKLALEQIEKAGGADGALAEAWCRVQEAIGDLLLLETESEQARAAFESALGHTPPIASVARAQRHRKVALTWERQHQHASALAAYEQAEIALGPGPNDATTAQAWWIERVQIEVDKAWDLYWMDDVEGLATLVTRVRPMIDEHGLAHQRAQFFQACVHMCFRRDRYVIDDETVQYARASLADAERARDIRGLAFARFCLAFTLLLKGCEAEAEPILAAGLSDSELVGDRTLRARYLSYRSMLLRRLGRAAEAAAVASDAAEIAAAVDALDYVGVAHSTLCWVAWREGDHAGVERHAEIATGAWRKLLPKYVYPLHWLVRVPRACHFVETGQWASACDEWRALLDPRQHRLPQPLAEAIDAAVGETDHGALARRAAAVIEHCKSYRYL